MLQTLFLFPFSLQGGHTLIPLTWGGFSEYSLKVLNQDTARGWEQTSPTFQWDSSVPPSARGSFFGCSTSSAVTEMETQDLSPGGFCFPFHQNLTEISACLCVSTKGIHKGYSNLHRWEGQTAKTSGPVPIHPLSPPPLPPLSPQAGKSVSLPHFTARPQPLTALLKNPLTLHFSTFKRVQRVKGKGETA